MARGGKREGAGRPKGALNKRTIKVAEASAEGGITPLEYLLAVLRNEKNDGHVRLDAAKAAAPYVHPRLTSIAHSGKLGVIVNIAGDDAALL